MGVFYGLGGAGVSAWPIWHMDPSSPVVSVPAFVVRGFFMVGVGSAVLEGSQPVVATATATTGGLFGRWFPLLSTAPATVGGWVFSLGLFLIFDPWFFSWNARAT